MNSDFNFRNYWVVHDIINLRSKLKLLFLPAALDMARNKGLIPSSPGEISGQRKQLKAIIDSLLPACTEPDIETGEPFRAQAIIANPPAYG